jgi:hypothetical protein
VADAFGACSDAAFQFAPQDGVLGGDDVARSLLRIHPRGFPCMSGTVTVHDAAARTASSLQPGLSAISCMRAATGPAKWNAIHSAGADVGDEVRGQPLLVDLRGVSTATRVAAGSSASSGPPPSSPAISSWVLPGSQFVCES